MAKLRHAVGLGSALALIAALTLAATRGAQDQDAPRSTFYFWQTTWTAEVDPRDVVAASRLFVRFFDVAVDETGAKAVPVAPITFAAPLPAGVEVVPVVYLTNAVFGLDALDVDALAGKILTKVAAMAAPLGLELRELQLDCDWSDSTRAAYFRLLEVLRRDAPARLGAAGLTLSATIRLHQVKYRQRTGVPPVDRGMLMFYNMGSLTDPSERPSIFNGEDAGRYVAWVEDYPLPLDLALPVFGWAIQRRGAETVALIEGVAEAEFAASELFAPDASGRHVARTDGFFRGRYFRAGDVVRFETSTPEITREAAALVAKHQPRRAPFATIAFFDLNPRNLARYEHGFFAETLAAFR